MFCYKCGAQMKDGDRFCPVCGAPKNDITNDSFDFDKTPVNYPQPAYTQAQVKQTPNPYPRNVYSQSPVKEEPVKKKKSNVPLFIIMGVLGVVLIAAIVFAVILLTGGNGSSESTVAGTVEETAAEETAGEEAAESRTEEETAAEDESQAEEETAAEDESQAAEESENPSDEEEENAAAAVSLEDVYAAYREILLANQTDIESYDWQFYGDEAVNNAPVSFADIDADGIPELFYVTAPINEYGYSIEAIMHICTCENGAAREIYSCTADWQAGGGVRYCLFTTDDGKIYLYYSSGDESWTNTWYLLSKNENGELNTYVTAMKHSGPNEDYSEYIVNYYIDGEETDEGTYTSFITDLCSRKAQWIIHNTLSYEETVADYFNGSDCLQMSLSDALNLCSQNSRTDDSAPSTEPDGLPSLPESFTFASGAGGWATTLYIYDDWSGFSGNYYDSDMGSGGDGYDATLYVCEFSGTFSSVEKVSDSCYRLTLGELNYDEDVDSYYIENRVKYVNSYPYGIYGGDTFYIYLPEMPSAELSQGFKDWVSYLNPPGDTYLGYTALYNEKMEQVFIGY